MTRYRWTSSARPLDSTHGLQPMDADDEAFWQWRRSQQAGEPEPMRRVWLRFWLGLAGLAAVACLVPFIAAVL